MTRILIADDSESILLLLSKRLEMAGYEVMTAVNGEEVLEALESASTRPDLVLLDAMMPVKSGIEALREMREAGNSTPVLIISAHRDAAQSQEALDAGADDWVGKPIDWDELARKIEKLAP